MVQVHSNFCLGRHCCQWESRALPRAPHSTTGIGHIAPANASSWLSATRQPTMRSNSASLQVRMSLKSKQQRIRIPCDALYFWHMVLQCGLIAMCLRTPQAVPPCALAFSLTASLVHLCLNCNIPDGQPSPLPYPCQPNAVARERCFFALKTGTTIRKSRL